VSVLVHASGDFARFAVVVAESKPAPLSRHPEWLTVLRYGLRHEPYLLEAAEGGRTVGLLPLVLVRSFLFGRFLVGLPYLNTGGVISEDGDVGRRLIDRAIDLADELRVRYLELRHERPVEHAQLTATQSPKVHMRRPLPAASRLLWESFPCKVRNQVRKGQKLNLTARWGGRELLPAFYAVFSDNMRYVGTPVYPLRLFAQVLRSFPDRAEICVVGHGDAPLAAALLLHGHGVTEIPSAGSLRACSRSCANMLLYWKLLERAIERGQSQFDFGRSTPGGGTYRFKKQWGAKPEPSAWQYYMRRGTPGELRPDSPRYQLLARLWRRLPLPLTRLLGPPIVRGIP